MISIPRYAPLFGRKTMLADYPFGTEVFVDQEFLKKRCGLFNPQLDKIYQKPWKVIDRYYVVGSRGSVIAALVIGIDYEHWATMVPNAELVEHTTYCNLQAHATFDHDDEVVRGTLVGTDIKPGMHKLCVLIVTDPASSFIDKPRPPALNPFAAALSKEIEE